MPAKITYKPNRATIARVKKGFYSGLKSAGATALSIASERLNVPAMSAAELARRDHPYASSKGSFGDLPSPQSSAASQYVGNKSGRIARSLYGSQRGFYYLIEFKNPPSYAKFVFDGTRVMLARQPLSVLQNIDKKKSDMILAGFKNAKGVLK